MIGRSDSEPAGPYAVRTMLERVAVPLVMTLALVACGRGTTEVEPAPGRPDASESSTTTTPPDTGRDPDGGDVATGDGSTITSSTPAIDPSTTTTSIPILAGSDNAGAYTELAVSGLVLTLDEQRCADSAVDQLLEEGVERIDAVISAVQECAAPAAVDAFAAGLLSAGGQPLPPTEAACVAARLRIDESYRPFWIALFDEEPFDFLVAPADAQDRYLDLFAECVSVGRALSEQVGGILSPPTIGCIDDLYQDREFVRVTIEADLTADADDLDRVNRQIATCLTADERTALNLA